MFDSLKKFFSPNAQQPTPPFSYEKQWRVSIDNNFVQVVDNAGQQTAVDFDDLAAIAIKTYDSGPATDDVWWVLIGKSLETPVTYPQGADGEKAVLDRLISLPDFRHEEMIKAMGSTQNEIFIVWTWE